MNGKGVLVLALALLLLVLASCGGQVTVVVTPEPPPEQATAVPTLPPPTPETGIEVLAITFAHGLSEQMEPVDPAVEFAPDEPVYLSVEIKGRPKAGLVKARFYFGDASIAEASVDLADANSGLLFSIGESTYAGYTLTHTDPFPLSDNYRAELFYEDVPIGTAAFRVVPPEDAIASQVTQAVLAKGADESYNPVEPTTVFSSDETVYLVGSGDLGVDSWLQADWYVGGQLDEAGTRSLTAQEDLQDLGFAFSYLPEGGWPAGEHFVVLTMNDHEVDRYAFTIAGSGGEAPLDELAFWDTFPLPEDAEIGPVVEGIDLGFTTALVEPQVFDFYAAWLSGQGWKQQVLTEAEVRPPTQIWEKDGAELVIEIQSVDDAGRSVVWVQLTTESSP